MAIMQFGALALIIGAFIGSRGITALGFAGLVLSVCVKLTA